MTLTDCSWCSLCSLWCRNGKFFI